MTTPIEPAADGSFDGGGAILIPNRLVLVRGEQTTARAELRFPPALAPWTILSASPGIASASGQIPIGGTSTVVKIEAKAPGETFIYYSVPNFGRAPSSHPIGVVLVLEQKSKNRAVRH
jgi:hypothetical protein